MRFSFFRCSTASLALQVCKARFLRLCEHNNNARAGRLCVAFAWGTVRIRGQSSATETDADKCSACGYCGCRSCYCSVVAAVALLLLLFFSASHTQQRELTTAFILGHSHAVCVRWPLSGRSCMETGLRANKTKISLPPRSNRNDNNTIISYSLWHFYSLRSLYWLALSQTNKATKNEKKNFTSK